MGFNLDYWQKVRRRTRRAVDLIPADRIEWAPAEGVFTLGDLVRHLAVAERYMFVENALRRRSRYPGHGPELASGLAAVKDLMDRLHQESVELLSSLGEDDLQASTTTPGGARITVWKWLRSMIEHECHHRGQVHTYLRLLGIEPPQIYGLREEEVQARSFPLGDEGIR